MIKAYLEQAIRSIEMEKEKTVNAVKDRIMREKIVPFNADLDASRAKALSTLDEELNAKVVELKKEYEAKKQELIALGEEKKKANAESIFATELAVLTVDYDSAIAKLTAQIAEIKE